MMIRTALATLASLAVLVVAPFADAESVSAGPIGSGLGLQAKATLPDGYKPTESPCQATLTEVRSRLPRNYGTTWLWSSGGSEWAGLYFPGQNLIIMSEDIRCQDVPIVALHEWAHQVQDANGLRYEDPIAPGVKRLEVIAECAARVLADHEGWPHYRSYPEITGVPCSEVSPWVQELLSKI